MGHTLVSGEEFCIQHPISTLLLSPEELCWMRRKNKVSRWNIRIQLSIILQMFHQIKIAQTDTSDPQPTSFQKSSTLLAFTDGPQHTAKNKSQRKNTKRWENENLLKSSIQDISSDRQASLSWSNLWLGLLGRSALLCLWCLSVGSLSYSHHDGLHVRTPRHHGVNTTDNTRPRLRPLLRPSRGSSLGSVLTLILTLLEPGAGNITLSRLTIERSQKHVNTFKYINNTMQSTLLNF